MSINSVYASINTYWCFRQLSNKLNLLCKYLATKNLEMGSLGSVADTDPVGFGHIWSDPEPYPRLQN
jgi:hypothetical protein